MNYLVDTSALVRIQRNAVNPSWDSVIERGLVGICEPVLAETLTIADAKNYDRLEQRICALYPWVSVPDSVWPFVAAVRRELVKPSAYQGLSVADLVIAVTAMRLKLEVLHEDGDFETMARYVPELRQRRISAGPDDHQGL